MFICLTEAFNTEDEVIYVNTDKITHIREGVHMVKGPGTFIYFDESNYVLVRETLKEIIDSMAMAPKFFDTFSRPGRCEEPKDN